MMTDLVMIMKAAVNVAICILFLAGIGSYGTWIKNIRKQCQSDEQAIAMTAMGRSIICLLFGIYILLWSLLWK